MFSITRWALNNTMLTMMVIVLIVLAGPLSFQTHPSREDPEITIRTAVVTASFKGMSPKRMEDLVSQKLEEKIREMPEVKDILSTTRSGQVTINVNLHDRYYDLPPIWQSLRNKMEDVKSQLPDGTSGPFVNDSYGDVAMATIAVTAEGFSLAEMRERARKLRNKLYTVPGVSKISLYGVEPERIFVEANNIRLAQLGLSAQSLVTSIGQTNILSPGGRIEAGDTSLTIEITGNFETLDDVGQVTIQIPDKPGQVVYIRDIASIKRAYADPPKSPAFFNGKPAIVISVQMVEAYDSFQFGEDLKAKISTLENALPIGYQLSFITFQPNEIAAAVNGVMNNLYQTITIVLVIVMLFLGWRTGLIVGAMVPITMLLTLLIMRYVGIELEKMSLATLIISLGLLVDNGIVIAEEIERRLSIGEERIAAAIATGKAMALPLLSSSLTTIFAFMPLMLAESVAGEYTRSISLVIAIALLGSWVLALTVTPLCCCWFIKKKEPIDEAVAYDTKFYRTYRTILKNVLRFRYMFLVTVVATLFASGWLMQFVPKIFFPPSDRTQIQVYLDLPVGSNTYGTLAASKTLTTWLGNKEINPDITSFVSYVASGGPRFYLGLSPIDPDPHRAFMIVNVDEFTNMAPVMQRIQAFANGNIPEARIQVKPMSQGGSEAGQVEYRLIGDNADILVKAAHKLEGFMRDIPGTINIKDNWENRIIKLIVKVDQSRARRAGVTSKSIATALDSILSGSDITDYRDGDTIIPVYLRAEGDVRTNIDRLRTLNIATINGTPVPLLQVANLDAIAEFSMIQRRNLERVVTVSAKHSVKSAAELDTIVSARLDELKLPAGYRVEKGGEIEGSSEAQGSLFANMPLAFALIVLVLVGQFNSYRKPLIMLAVIPFTFIGASLGLLIMPGAAFGFFAILGLLALAGTIINNAIVLIDRIDIEIENGLSIYDAILTGSAKRLRPILMTTITTICGLAPIIISHDVLFYDLAIVLSGGLLVGTILTLGLVPVLYSILFRVGVSKQLEEATTQ